MNNKIKAFIKTQRLKLRNDRGFTLLEIIIAIAVLGIIGTGILISLGTSTKIFVLTNTQEIAKDIAANDMEYIRSLPFAGSYTLPPPSQPAEYSAYSAVATVTFLRVNEQRIDITVSLNGKIILFNGSTMLTDYRVHY